MLFWMVIGIVLIMTSPAPFFRSGIRIIVVRYLSYITILGKNHCMAAK
jgi:hypothetical protein